MKKLTLIPIIAVLLLLGILLVTVPQGVIADPLSQSSYQTPTPNADGQIIYTVEEGDNCTRIFLLTGVSIENIILLNNLDEDCSISPSQQLLLATVAPATATPEGPTPTPTQAPPTPTPFAGTAKVCVSLFEDLDGNQMRTTGEFYLAGGVVSINNREGSFSQTWNTIGGDPDLVELNCLENVSEGEYNLSMGIPAGYNATTTLNYALTVTAGDTVMVDFGAQPSSQISPTEDVTQGEGRSPLFLIIGLFLLAGGAGLAFFFIRSRQN
jgi:hypothetical protein